MFSVGDVEAQRKLWSGTEAKAILNNLDINLRFSTLLVDTVIHSASYYWESRFSRHVYRNHSVLFSSGMDNIFTFRSEVSDYSGHLEKKRKLCPHMVCYKGSKAKACADELQSLGKALHRTGNISERIAQLWTRDLAEETGMPLDSNSLDALLVENFRNPAKEGRYRRMLQRVVEKREDLELVRSYVEKKLSRFPKPLMSFVNDRLLYFYLHAVSDTMRVNLMDINGGTLYHGTQGISKQNIPLFISFTKILKIHPILIQMTDAQLLELKSRKEFVNVRNVYLRLVDEAKTMQENKMRLYWENFKEKARIDYARFSGLLKRASQIFLLLSLSSSLNSIENAIVSILTPEIVDLTIRRLIHVDKTLLNDLKSVVLEQYGHRLDNFAAKVSSGVLC